ncbi:DUF5677 domain-containing protein [Butyrivibrio sp. TB]|uniref:DUF5677 domain-containing protein n=1 Tax=Butyrivibrio sp. TB TaxID=1520809 RepID=UPI0008D2CD25|nr:DUF5677 domain-containing protein [Butyrivibrio sp. TB]SEQ64925.1 hypothetical protein SAMN02910382_03677 [Butyrivibrio sp. TB]
MKKRAIKEIESIFKYDIGMDKIEPMGELVSFGALYRSCLCIESIIVLIENGYYGSANALFRQVYEQLVWAKIAIDNDDTNLLIKIHDDYYNKSSMPEKDRLNKYYTKLKFISYDDSIDDNIIRNEGRKVFSLYSNYVHGTSQAQQNPVASDLFYINMGAVVQETSLWIECLIELMQSCLLKCQKLISNNINSIDYYLVSHDSNKYIVANYLMEIMYAHKNRLRSVVPEINEQVIYKVFANTRWTLFN